MGYYEKQGKNSIVDAVSRGYEVGNKRNDDLESQEQNRRAQYNLEKNRALEYSKIAAYSSHPDANKTYTAMANRSDIQANQGLGDYARHDAKGNLVWGTGNTSPATNRSFQNLQNQKVREDNEVNEIKHRQNIQSATERDLMLKANDALLNNDQDEYRKIMYNLSSAQNAEANLALKAHLTNTENPPYKLPLNTHYEGTRPWTMMQNNISGMQYDPQGYSPVPHPQGAPVRGAGLPVMSPAFQAGASANNVYDYHQLLKPVRFTK